MQPVRQRFEILGPTVFMPLMEHMVDHVHTSRQVGREWNGDAKFAETGEVASTICVQIPLRLWNNVLYYLSCSKHAQTILKTSRQFFPGLKMFEEMFDTEPGTGAVRKGENP